MRLRVVGHVEAYSHIDTLLDERGLEVVILQWSRPDWTCFRHPIPELQHSATDGKVLSLLQIVQPRIRSLELVLGPTHRSLRFPGIGGTVVVEDALEKLTFIDASPPEALNERRVVCLAGLAGICPQMTAIDQNGYRTHMQE